MTTPPQVRVGALTITAMRPRELARFYAKLLGWTYLREEAARSGEPSYAGYALICPPDGTVAPALNFDYDANFRRPVWPTVPGEQSPTIHLDLGVDDLDVAVGWATDCGATVADLQARPSEHRVMLDPEGHPFCLCLP